MRFNPLGPKLSRHEWSRVLKSGSSTFLVGKIQDGSTSTQRAQRLSQRNAEPTSSPSSFQLVFLCALCVNLCTAADQRFSPSTTSCFASRSGFGSFVG